MAAAQGLTVEITLGQWLFKPGALHLIHVDRPDPYEETRQAHKIWVILLNLWLIQLWLDAQVQHSYHVHYGKIISEERSSIAITGKKKLIFGWNSVFGKHKPVLFTIPEYNSSSFVC